MNHKKVKDGLRYPRTIMNQVSSRLKSNTSSYSRTLFSNN